MLAQEIVDRVYQHFIVEKNPPSIDKDGRCLYRGPNGTKCAAGLFIKDEEYKPDFEGMTAYTLGDTLPALRDKIIIGLQMLHDQCTRECVLHKTTFLELFSSELQRYCEDNGFRFGLDHKMTTEAACKSVLGEEQYNFLAKDLDAQLIVIVKEAVVAAFKQNLAGPAVEALRNYLQNQ